MKIAFSLVVDSHPRFEWQAFLLVHSLLRNLRCVSSDIKIHCLPDVSNSFCNEMHQIGVEIIQIQPFPGHRYCNKIQQCFSNVFTGYDLVVLMDCDLFVFDLPNVPKDIIFAAKVVDLPNPPIQVLERIYQARGLLTPEVVPVDFGLSHAEVTYSHNFNGGVYFIRKEYLSKIGGAWRRHAEWLIQNKHFMESWDAHIDQVAMSLAITELGIQPYYLSSLDNFPIHLEAARIELHASPNIRTLHYHSNFLSDGKIKFTGVETVDNRIGFANQQISAILENHFENVLFWNMRYKMFPELGSGLGSRGAVLNTKKNLLSHAIYGFLNEQVIEIGCGDIQSIKDFKFTNYTGYDISREAIEIAQRSRPDWNFALLPEKFTNFDVSADLVICLDVLIHQKSKEKYYELIQKLVNMTRKRLIISGYEQRPSEEYFSDICAYHEPLSQSLARFGTFSEIIKIGYYRDVLMIVADKGGNLITNLSNQAYLDAILQQVERPDWLRLIADVSYHHFGFYTQTVTRNVEYPWVLMQIMQSNPGRVLDIGAGVSPLPIILAEHGWFVTTVDNHSVQRSLDDKKGWNEWGFLDYSSFVPSIISLNKNILEYTPHMLFDVVYSVSVIEHMPRSVREKLIAKLASWLVSGGRVILSVDLIPNTDYLWNLSEGREVEPVDKHGTLSDLVQTFARHNFKQKQFRIIKVPGARTDVALINFEITKSSGYLFLEKIVRQLSSKVHLK